MENKTLILSEKSQVKLSKLAMAVELVEQKRFTIQKSGQQLIQLINLAMTSSDADISQSLLEFVSTLSADNLSLLESKGIRFAVDEPAPKTESKIMYRGKPVIKSSPPERPTTEPANSNIKKKRIMYRGQVSYV